jgi:hypothetical protein
MTFPTMECHAWSVAKAAGEAFWPPYTGGDGVLGEAFWERHRRTTSDEALRVHAVDSRGRRGRNISEALMVLVKVLHVPIPTTIMIVGCCPSAKVDQSVYILAGNGFPKSPHAYCITQGTCGVHVGELNWSVM